MTEQKEEDRIEQLVEEELDEMGSLIEEIVREKEEELIQKMVEEKIAEQKSSQTIQKPNYGG